MTRTSLSEYGSSARSAFSTNSRHFPLPSPNAPSKSPPPSSSSLAVNVRAAFGGTATLTSPPSTPPSSTAVTTTSASSPESFTSRSMLTWFSFEPGLKKDARRPALDAGIWSCMEVRNPSSVRT